MTKIDSSFFEKSKEIADNFIQSVLFVDDEIYTDKNDTEHNLDAKELITAFSKARKLCALNNPRNEGDFNDVIEIAKSADITVLDWKMDLPRTEENETNEEADVEEDDPRGTFTLRLINEILSDHESVNTFKLVLIYTGEVGLSDIVEKIETEFKKFDLIKESNNIIGKKNIKIIVAGKPSLIGKFKHAQEFEDWILNYDQIPNFLLTEFTKMTQGIISNVALQAITGIRNNTFELLSKYNTGLDPAYLSHRAMLTNPDDADNLLLSAIRDSLDSILRYANISEICDINSVMDWIDSNDFDDHTIKINKFDLNIGKDQLGKWQEYGYREFFKNEFKSQKNSELPDEKVDNFGLNNLYKEAPKLFMPKDIDSNGIHEDFAILTHLSSSLENIPKQPPILSLGTVVRKNTIYYLCIQQPCDSVRISNETRRFRFLPLEVCDKKFNIIYKNKKNEYIKLKLKNSNSFDLLTFSFNPNQKGFIKARKDKNRFYFKDKKGDDYTWILDLKISHAQKFLNEFAAKVSRVGLDESEWLRRS